MRGRPNLALTGIATALALAAPALAARPVVTVFKSATCDCCGRWVEHLEANGFDVRVNDVADLDRVKRDNRVPPALGSCHTALVGGYFVEGHVPAEDVKRLLKERPRIAGIVLPGMPIGSPGMEGPDPQPFDVLAVDARGETKVFASHRP